MTRYWRGEPVEPLWKQRLKAFAALLFLLALLFLAGLTDGPR